MPSVEIDSLASSPSDSTQTEYVTRLAALVPLQDVVVAGIGSVRFP
jgi:hypothetical protein